MKKQSMQCLVTGQNLTEDQALRFVAGPDGLIWFDPSFKAEGQAVYVVNNATVLQEAVDKGLLVSTLAANLQDVDLRIQVENMLEKRWLGALSLARKSQDLVLGVEKLEKSFFKGSVAFAVVPVDIGSDALKKMHYLKKEGLTLINVGNKQVLSCTLGVPNVSAIGVLKGHAATKVDEMLKRYQSFRR